MGITLQTTFILCSYSHFHVFFVAWQIKPMSGGIEDAKRGQNIFLASFFLCNAGFLIH